MFGHRVVVADDPVSSWAGSLLRELGASVVVDAEADALLAANGVEVFGPRRSPAQEWARSGAMALTGHPNGPALLARGQAAVAARGAALAVELLSALHEGGRRVAVDGARLLGERAALAGLQRRGRTSCGGATRLLSAADGWLAVSLARSDDIELLPALLERDDVVDPWAAVEAWARGTPAAAAAQQAQELGIPSGALPTDGADPQQRERPGGPTGKWTCSGTAGRRVLAPRRVVDLSALWAGPLCAHLLGLAGLEVVKVESPVRADGARRGEPRFFDLLNAGHRSVSLDLASAQGRAQLDRLVRTADVVVESSRARASERLGLRPEDLVREHPGMTWVSITAYGRTGPWADRVGFGDDVAVAGGLIADAEGGPVFAGDAVADPLTGLHAAVAALAGMHGGGGLVDLAMRDVAAAAAGPVDQGALPDEVGQPVARASRGAARARGADTARYVA